jgi:hypothetical protein
LTYLKKPCILFSDVKEISGGKMNFYKAEINGKIVTRKSEHEYMFACHGRKQFNRVNQLTRKKEMFYVDNTTEFSSKPITWGKCVPAVKIAEQEYKMLKK